MQAGIAALQVSVDLIKHPSSSSLATVAHGFRTGGSTKDKGQLGL
jgi:hypothetical protein